MREKKIVIRADASVRIGSGHVMRCLALAERLRDAGVEIAFICRLHPGNLVELIRKHGFVVHELPGRENFSLHEDRTGSDSRDEYAEWLGATCEEDAIESIAALNGIRPDWLIVDHYSLDRTWEKLLRPNVQNVMVIDDLADRPHDADLLLDQNYFLDGAHRYDGMVSPACTMLLGPSFALLRPEFSESRKNASVRSGQVHRILVFFGGSDQDNLTARTLEALRDPRLKHLDVEVVVGAGNPHIPDIRSRGAAMRNARLHIQVDNMAELMSRADIAVGAGGTATWERFCLGLSSIVVTIAENQIPFIRDLHAEGVLQWLGTQERVTVEDISKAILALSENPDINRCMSIRGVQMVDGNGTAKSAEILLKGVDSDRWTVRRAVQEDCLLYWHWANDEEVRRNAFNQETICWNAHQVWFSSKLNDPDTILLVVNSDLGPIGQVRFDQSVSDCYVIDYSIVRQFRGLGLGQQLLAKAINELRGKGAISLIGEVKKSNLASAKIFERLGFEVLDDYPLALAADCIRYVINMDKFCLL